MNPQQIVHVDELHFYLMSIVIAWICCELGHLGDATGQVSAQTQDTFAETSQIESV
jgi:hypothetical protein